MINILTKDLYRKKIQIKVVNKYINIVYARAKPMFIFMVINNDISFIEIKLIKNILSLNCQ